MSDLICRKSMMRCQTPGMCSPHGGCQDPVNAQLRAVNFDYQLGADAAKDEIARLKAECEGLRKALLEASEEIATWGAYASDYFQEKHDLAGCVAKFHDAAIGREGQSNG